MSTKDQEKINVDIIFNDDIIEEEEDSLWFKLFEILGITHIDTNLTEGGIICMPD